MKISSTFAQKTNHCSFFKIIFSFCFILLAAQLTFAQTGKALAFDGVDDRVSLPLAFTGSYTKEAWIKPDAATLATTSPNIFSGELTALYILNKKLTAGHAGPNVYADVQDAAELVADTWYHIAVSYDAGTGNMRLYKDGSQVGFATGVTPQTENFQFLSYFFGSFFSGEMDEVRFWKSVRTAGEIAANKDCELSGDEPFLVAYYNFNQGTAGASNPGLVSLLDTQDKCSAPNNGTLENFALTGTTSNWVDPGPAVSGSCGSFPNINLIGNLICIANADATPAFEDHTKFENQLVAPVTRTFTIQNTGGTTLNIGSVILGGTNASDFSITSSPASSIAANSSTTFTVSFSTSVAGAVRSATVTINSDDADEAAYTFAIEGKKTTAGTALDFDGVDDKVDLPFIFSGSYTKEAWIKTRSLAGTPNILSGTGTALYLKDGKITAGGHSGLFDQAQDATPINIDTWYHVAVSYNASTQEMKLYRDGALVATSTSVPAYTETEQKIGSYTGIFNFWGQIDQVRFWTVERTPTEINNSYNCKISGDEPGLLAWYNFSNGFGESNNPGLTTLEDLSDKCTAYNGTLTGFALNGSTSNWVADSVTLSGNCAALFANIRIAGNNICILNNDATPSAPDNTDFGSTAGNTKTFSITNTGTATLNITGISFTGTDNSMFTVSSAPASPLLPGLSTTLTVQFTPTSLGEKVAEINIANDDPDEGVYIFSIKGTGVTAPTGTPVFTVGATTVCQDAADETYTATAENSTSITYSVLPVEAGVINSTSGVMNWDPAFTGTATVTATATGLDGTTTADRVVTVNPSTGATNFTAGATTLCQDAADETYTATASNSTSIVYSVLPVEAGTINASTGVMDWDASFSGTATITATSTGLCGTTTADRVVTVNPSTGITTFTAGATTVCQDAADETYTATAANSTSITYSVLPVEAGVINSATGVMDWDAAFSGTATITATSTGLCGTTTADRVVTVNPSTGATTFTAGATSVCQNAADETYTAAASNSTSIVYSVLTTEAGVINASTGVMDWDAAFSGTATITATSTGLCGTTTADRVVTVNPSTGITTFTAGATTLCQDAADETYTATAANSNSIVYSVLPVEAGVINASTGVMDWDAAFSGTATITATSTGLCGTSTSDRVVTVNPSTGATTFTAGATSVCQNSADETYTATAANSTSIVYSVLPTEAGVINASTGLMDWDAAFSGTATITATSTGLCGTTTADLVVTVNPSTGITTFTAGATTVCQDAADETYTATASNSTSIVYSVLPVEAGTINASTGVMDWDAAFSGTATITATSTGLCGTSTADRVVTVNPSTGITTFTAGATTVCQDAANETYTATAANSTGITYSVLPVEAGVINAATGVMDWDAAFSGTATITATSTGLCGTTTADRVVTVNPSTGTTTFTAGATTVCQNAADETYTATAANSTSITYSLLPVEAGVINASTGVMDWDAAFSGTATITAISTGLCGTTTADRVVTVNPSTGATIFTAGTTTVCQNAADETYTATAANSTSIIYSVLPVEAGVINASTGVMDWDAAFSGTATITATSTGLCGTTTADRVVTVNPSTGTTTFTAGATTVCQDAADETYTAIAANSTGITYAVLPVEAGTINTSTGVMDWDAAFSGTATITATSTGLCGTTTADRVVTVNPSTGATIFTAGATTVCQNAADETYTAIASNSTSIVYSVLPVEAGVINTSTGLMDWEAAFSGAATITATSTGLCGTTTADRVVTVNPSTGTTIFTTGSTTVCQNAADETYTATAANSTSIVYSVLPVEAGVINASTGLMDWDAAFSGTATITATSTGLCGTTTADRVVTINPSTGTTTFTAGETSVCQNSADETYTATAANSTSITFSVLPVEAGTINASTGVMDWDAAFSGTATITATSTGLCGTTTADRVVTVNPSTGTTTFTAGATTVCQNAADETYTATAANSTGITYSVSPVEAGVINASTGVMDWDAAFSGTATITATSTGLCGTTTADRVVTVNAFTGTTSFSAGATTVCQNATDETYTATAANSTSVTYSVLPVEAGTINAATGLMDWDAAFSGTATITATSTGLCGTTTADRVVTVNPSTGATTFTTGATTVCQNATDETYTAIASNSTSIVYSVLPVEAGVINASTGVMDWDAAFSGTATITATATGLCETTTTDRVVTVNSSTGATTFTAGATTVCQDAADETYTATAANSTSIVYSVLPVEAGVINASTGVMDWDAAFSGTATITATSTGLCGTTTADRVVTVNPSTGITTFTAGATTVCQNAADETYTATAANSTSITYSVLPVEAGTINTSTGVMDWDATFTGTATITATSTGLCGTTTADRAVTVNPSTGTTTFTAGATTVCQDAADETYTAIAVNSTSITYSVLPVEAGTINASTGVMDWDAAFSGTATIKATSTGLCGTTTADRVITVNPSTGTTTFTAGATTLCQNAADETYTATAANSNSIVYSVLPVEAGIINASSGVMDWNAAFSGTATITATSTGLCGTTTADRVVTVNPSTGTTTFTAGATTICQNAADETYTATAANSTSIVYSVLPVEAGTSNASTGVMDWDAAFSGTATITATATGLCGTTTADRVVTVNSSTGATTFTAGATTVCQNAADETYTATAANSSSITYSVLPVEAGTINASTGVIDWDAAFSGTATITATATGLCGTTTADRVVTVNPSTGATTFTAGATTVCQDAANETYTATATNSTSITYSVLPVEAGTINAATGLMDWDAAFSGTATITATSTGLCGTTTIDRVVTVNPSTGATIFTAGATTVCQNAADETYTATAANSTSITFSVLPVEAGTVNASTGVMDWDAAFSGTATITATSTGLCGTTTADRVVTVNPSTGTTTFTAGATTVCQNAADETYTATAANRTSIVYSVLPVEAGVINASTGSMDWDAAFSGTATITATSTGLCGTTTADRVVTVNPSTGTITFTAGATTVCQNSADETYTATAANSSSITYSVLPVEAGTINASTGVMDWDAAFSGTATITATSTGLCGTITADRVVTVNPSTGTTTFTAGATTVCQNSADETYTATATNSTSITYSVLPVEAGVINASTGVMDWDAAFSGTATITATATGLCGTTTADRVVTVNTKPNIGADITIYHNCVGETTDLEPLFNTTGLTFEWNTATPNAVVPGLYRLIVTNGVGCSDTAFVNVVLEVAVWTGTISSDWHTPGNWNINKVPTAQTHVIVDNTTINECIISNANAAAASVQTKTGTVTKIENNREIIISGNCANLPTN